MNFLSQVIAHKKKEVVKAKRKIPLAFLVAEAKKAKRKKYSFKKALLKKPIALIAEIKLKSPSRGILTSENFLKFASVYAKSNADAISILTDKKYFNGSTRYMAEMRNISTKPILRKDFIIDEYQVYESFLAGADAILLIVAALSESKLKEFLKLGESLGLDALVEVHSEPEIKKALVSGAKIIGINNRNLKTLTIDLANTEKLMKIIPKGVVVVSESGISSSRDVKRLKSAGVDAILVGSSIVTARNPQAKIKELTLR